MPRSSLMVSKEFAAALADDAEKQGKPLYYVANDVVKIYLRSRQKGYDLGKILETFEALDLSRRMGCVVAPDSLIDDLITRTDPKDLDRYFAICEGSGRSMGMYARSVYETPVDAVKKLFSNVFWDLHLDINSFGGKGVLYVACGKKSAPRASLVAHLIKGFLEAFDCFAERTKVMEGLIRIEFSVRPTIKEERF